jgi:hypothetical protein
MTFSPYYSGVAYLQWQYYSDFPRELTSGQEDECVVADAKYEWGVTSCDE